MSTVSGLNAKAEKGKPKYVALDINSIYKGKSLDNPKATVQPKHGLQSLGKVGAGRRMPPPANLPSLKSENSGNNPNISLVPSGGQGWGSATKEKGKTEESSGNQQQSPQSQPASSHSQTTQKTQAITPNATATPGVSKTWSSVTSNQEDGGQERSFLAQQSPFFPQEFPKLAGGDAQTEGNQKSNADSQYGPGPSLRPQTEGSWGRGTLQQQHQQQVPPGPTGGQQPSSGSGVNGQQPSGEPQPLPSSQQHARERPFSSTSRGGPAPPSNSGSGNSTGVTSGTPVLVPCPSGPNPGMGGQMGPGSALHPPPPQFTRGMMQHPYMYGRNSYPSGYQSNYSGLPPAPPPPARQAYPYPENRRPQPVRPLAEEEAYQRPAAIITEKALKGFDEILQNDTQDTWATSHGEIDYNAKLVFSDDEEAPVLQKDKRDDDDKSSRGHDSSKRDKERERELDRNLSEREREERSRESDWGRDNRSDKKPERELDWCGERREAFDRDRDERWKGWAPPPQGRPPPSLGIEMQRQWQSSQTQQRMPFDYRGPPPPPQPPGTYAPPHVRIGPGPPPIPQHPCYPPPPPRPSRSGQRPSSVTEDEELWRQRRKQHSDEMNMAVERARQRRAEEEKHYEQSKQSAQEKAKTFEKSDKEIKENMDLDDHERSRHSSESREDKPPSRDGRDRDRSQTNFQGFGFSRQFQKHVPPRFQKQAELRQQQTQQPPLQTSTAVPPSPPTQQSQHFLRQSQQPQTIGPGVQPPAHPISPGSSGHGTSPQTSLPMGVNFDPRCGTHVNPSYSNQVSGLSVSKSMPRPRSNSQGSGTDSYESDRCTPDQAVLYDRDSNNHYWNHDRRQAIPPGGYESWRATSETEGYYESSEAGGRVYEQRVEFKRAEKDGKTFDSHTHEMERREREFENQDCRYKSREGSFKERDQKQVELVREVKDRDPKSNSWSNRHFNDRTQDTFDKSPEIKSGKERHERLDRERPQRPDSRDSRASRESLKEERHPYERHETQGSHVERERKFPREDKEKLLNWGDTPYNPSESKSSSTKREWHHYPPPITAKQFESVAPPKKNLTTLRRSTNMPVPQSISDSKTEIPKSDSNKQSDIELNLKKEKDAKEEKNEKIRCESSVKELEKCDEKADHSAEKKALIKENHKDSESESTTESQKKDTVIVIDEKEKCIAKESKEKSEHPQGRNDQVRDRRRDGRDRITGNSRIKGNSSTSTGNVTVGGNGNGNNRFDSSRGGRGSRGGGGFGGSSSGFRGRSREYRRSRVERGPRFDRQKERDKDKSDKKEKHTDDSSFSETEDGKLGHLRQKDEDSEVSVDEASASTTESAQAEKYQAVDGCPEDKNLGTGQFSIHKDDFTRSEKTHKDKKDNCRKDSKSFDHEKIKDDKGGFAPRGEPSRRGRGGGTVSFRNSRGGLRYGPSNYGPPPSTAAFGSRKLEKPEQQKSEDVCKDASTGEYQSSVQQSDSTNNLFNRDANKSHSLERSQQRRQNRFEHLPPRLQKRQARRYDNYDPIRGRGRGRNYNYQGSNSQMPNKTSQGAKENLSDVANEEWETASESSDVAERRDRRDDLKDELKKKDFKDKGNPSSRKSFSSQRPTNDVNQLRRSGTDSRRGNNNSERNRQRDGFGRDNRGRDSGRNNRVPVSGNFTGGNGGTDRRLLNNSGNNSRPNSAGQSGGLGGRNTRSGHSQSTKTSAFPPKNEGTTAVYRVDEIKLQDPNCVQTAIADIAQRKSLKSDVAAGNRNLKTEKEKTGGLEGYDLNNYASVVIIDDHPEIADESALLCDAEDGFQEVTSKKRHKAALDADIKKIKKEPHTRNKSGSRSRQSRLPPRFAKIRESGQLKTSIAATSSNSSWDIGADMTSVNSKQSAQFNIKDASPAPPPSVNAWEKPITHSLQLHSSSIGQNGSTNNLSSNTSNTVISVTCASSTSMAADMPILASSSKSSSFDRSDQHDSGIDVSDQPASAASSQRSSPSNDCKILTPKGSSSSGKVPVHETCTDLVTDIDSCKPMCTVVFENKNFKAENAVLDKFGGQAKNQLNKESPMASDHLTTVVGNIKSKESSDTEETKALKLPVTFSTKDPFGKGEGNDMKLDFTFDSELAQLTNEKTVSNGGSNNTIANSKTINIGRSVDVSNGSAPVGVQSPISPSADELNLKIASVKKVWENVSPMPTVLEHPQTSSVNEENSCQTSYSSYSGNPDPSNNSYNSTVDSVSQARKDSSIDSPDMSFRENIPLQQNCNSGLITKTVDPSSICSMKPQQVHLPQHNQMPGPHCAGSVSPPLIGGLENTMTGIRTIPGLASSVQVAGIPAIPSPPTVLFNSSQQMAQTGLYQPLQMDSRQNQAAAVAAAMVQFSQSPHGYALGTYGLSHQPSAQLSNAFGQQNLFVQQPSAHQGQDMYTTNQYRVQPPYQQTQHVTSSQVLSAQPNMASSHLLGSQLVQTRPAAGPSASAPHLQGLHGLQPVQPGSQTSYYSSTAQAQTAASFYHQPPTTPGSPMQQQPQFPSHQGYGSQSALNVLPQPAAVTANYRTYGSHQFKTPVTVMNNMVPESSTSMRSVTRSPTMDSSASRMFAVGNTTTTTMNSGSVMAVPQISSPGVVGKMGQPQVNASSSSRLGSNSNSKTTQYTLPQSQQHYYPFGQQKFGHVQSSAVRPQVVFPNMVRNSPHPSQHVAPATSIHYPPPIQRPGGHTNITQTTTHQPTKLGNRSQVGLIVPGGKLTHAEQAKLRAEAVQQTHMFFAQTKTGKHEEVAGILMPEKSGLQGSTSPKLSTAGSAPEDNQDSSVLSPVSDSKSAENIEIKEGKEVPAVEE